MAEPKRGTRELLGDDQQPDEVCASRIDLDPWATIEGGLYANCELSEGHAGSHRRLLTWKDDHPDAL